ncbi:TetR/AcrR family transcriptional regulator [Actinomadura macrotermitis]|uniref:HTH tetR-type domain-containing protein n=1 Tax=Actinomadura macrotermitis TaxID=2585200 RepID=A0A7K0C7C2_9ACTN|nr:TetR/AcrR family transcriptional regulator [Actinomadura macrotermitis]MQY09236.1 hypothetical protein [Actinomadura macrotermitis]
MTNDPGRPARRRPAGAAVLRPHLTAAITEAVFAELAEVGYGRLTMEAVARRAGVSKPTLYRRWPAKEAMVAAVAGDVVTAVADVPDTGSLRGDVGHYLAATAGMLRHPLASRIIPDLLAEAGRASGLADALLVRARDVRREKAAELLRRGIARGELPPDLPVQLALDLLVGPLFWRLIIARTPTGPDHLDRLTDMLLAAFGARGPGEVSGRSGDAPDPSRTPG